MIQLPSPLIHFPSPSLHPSAPPLPLLAIINFPSTGLLSCTDAHNTHRIDERRAGRVGEEEEQGEEEDG
ncbi:hypothetical protein E2C01_101504 [Portunus trituberculatus]|uniref:Uncharacterized protein n=1 Tax=Portunus trituberculatus TaxID=210409 RepID=A0A5B7KFX4_PORTR|nr:hypothetical protein [Portunus trituberculatus]